MQFGRLIHIDPSPSLLEPDTFEKRILVPRTRKNHSLGYMGRVLRRVASSKNLSAATSSTVAPGSRWDAVFNFVHTV